MMLEHGHAFTSSVLNFSLFHIWERIKIGIQCHGLILPSETKIGFTVFIHFYWARSFHFNFHSTIVTSIPSYQVPYQHIMSPSIWYQSCPCFLFFWHILRYFSFGYGLCYAGSLGWHEFCSVWYNLREPCFILIWRKSNMFFAGK